MMLRAYSMFKDLDKKPCEILTNTGIELSDCEESPNKEQLLKLLQNYDILIIGVKEGLTEDMLKAINNKKIIATLSIGVDHIDNSFFQMKKTATFINTSKAEILDMNELIRHADENVTFSVGLDIDAENYKEMLNIKGNNVIVTPQK